MRYLMDAHSLIWAQDDPGKLGQTAITILEDSANQLLLSSGTVWELSIKSGLAKLTLSPGLRRWMDRAITDLDLVVLPITLDHADRQAHLPWHHRDPFDRLLAAQALVEGIPLISADLIFDPYGTAFGSDHDRSHEHDHYCPRTNPNHVGRTHPSSDAGGGGGDHGE